MKMVLVVDKWVETLAFLLNNNSPSVNSIAKGIDVTYSHTMKIVNVLEEMGFIKSNKSGRNRSIKLTRAGTELAKSCSHIISFLENDILPK